jgi:hypothetical protein
MSHNIDISIGLGYGSSNGSAAAAAAATAPSSIDDLMKHYLKQCLDYHQEQQQQQQQAGQVHQLEAPVFVESLEDAIPASVQTADGCKVFSTKPNTIEISPTTNTNEACLAKSIEPLHMTQEENKQQSFQADALAKARAVVLSFSAPTPSADLSPSEYREQRMRHAQQEQDRFHQALMKNFRYIAQRQDEKLQSQLLQIERAKAYEKQLCEQQHARFLQRTKCVASNREPERRVAVCNSAALYVAGIPAGGTEDLLRGLFGSYGTISKVHLYRDRATGDFKGDALLVFQLGPTQDKEHLVNLVCTQVSGH